MCDVMCDVPAPPTRMPGCEIPQPLIDLQGAPSISGDEARLLYAAAAASVLEMDALGNGQTLLDLGLHHGILTAATSLLVLRDPDDYVRTRACVRRALI